MRRVSVRSTEADCCRHLYRLERSMSRPADWFCACPSSPSGGGSLRAARPVPLCRCRCNTVMASFSLVWLAGSIIPFLLIGCSNMNNSSVCMPRLPSSPDAVATPGEEAMKDDAGEIFTLDEVAAYLKVGKRTIYRLAAARRIPAFKVGGTWRFSRADIDSWIKQQSSVDHGIDNPDLSKEERQP